MNIEKDKKSNITKQRLFVDDWLRDLLFKDWLHKYKNDDIVARCFIRSKTISLSTAGRSALVEHGNGAKHQTALGKRNNFFKPKRKNDENMQHDTTDTVCTSSNQTVIDGFVKNTENTKAEVIWMLKSVISGFSNQSCEGLSNTFASIFLDSKIAKEFVLGRQKAMYLSTYRIAPCFKSLLKSEADGSPILVISFDETLDQITQTCEMMIL